MATRLGEDRKDALCYQLQGAHFLLQLGHTLEDHRLLLQSLHRAHHHILPLIHTAPLQLSGTPFLLSESDLRHLDLHRNEALECIEGALWLLEHQSHPQLPSRVSQMGLLGVADLISDAWTLMLPPQN